MRTAPTLREAIATLLRGRVAIVGIGNRLRGDDAFGSLLAEELGGGVLATVIDAEDIPETYVVAVIALRPDTVLFLDAVDLGRAPGAVALLACADLAAYQPSTHRLPLGMLMEILERETGARIAVLAVQPGHTDLGQPPGREVKAAVASLAELLRELLPPRRGAPRDPGKPEGAVAP